MNQILTPDILQTMIICFSVVIVVICVSILIGHISRSKLSAISIKCEECCKVKQVSYRYIIGILVTIVVFLFSLYCYKIESFFDFMSFASAIVSIILAVLTIIYTYYTQGTTLESSEKIQKSSVSIAEATKNIQTATMAYSKTSETLEENIQKILAKLDGISERFGDGPEYMSQVQDAVKSQLTNEILTYFANIAPPAGCLLLYACGNSQNKNKVFKLSDFFPSDMGLYYCGFAIAVNSIGAATINLNIETTNVAHASILPQLFELIKNRIDKEMEQKNQFVIDTKSKIDEFFN